MSNDQLVPVSFEGLFSPGENVAKERSFELLPDGWYQGQIIESGAKESKSGGRYLAVTVEILAAEDGNPEDVKGRRLFTNVNLWHERQDVSSRAREDLKNLAFACKLATFHASSDFHGIPLLVKVGKGKVSDAFPEPKNEVKGWKPLKLPDAPTFGVATPAHAAAVPSAPAWQPAAPVAPPAFVAPVAPAPVWQDSRPAWVPPAPVGAPVEAPTAMPIPVASLAVAMELPQKTVEAIIAPTPAPAVAAPVPPPAADVSNVAPWMR